MGARRQRRGRPDDGATHHEIGEYVQPSPQAADVIRGLSGPAAEALRENSKEQTRLVQEDPWTSFPPKHGHGVLNRLRRLTPWPSKQPVGMRRPLSPADDRYTSHPIDGQPHKLIPASGYVLRRMKEELRRLPKTPPRKMRVGLLNAEFGNYEKALHFLDAYLALLEVMGLMGWEEVDEGFVDVLTRHSGHLACMGPTNSRGQGNAIIYDSRRLRLLEWCVLDATVGVAGIPDQRAAVSALFQDGEGRKWAFTDIHAKSKRGSKEARAAQGIQDDDHDPTHFVRMEQHARLGGALVRKWGKNRLHVVGGDYNEDLTSEAGAEEVGQLTKRLGVQLCPNAHCSSALTATQHLGCRIDAITVSEELFSAFSGYEVICGQSFWGDQSIGRGFTDHGIPTWEMDVGLL